MKKSRYTYFDKGDIIITRPEAGIYGIAVVLDDAQRLDLGGGKLSYPMCHIAITPLLYDHEPTAEEIDTNFLKPVVFDRMYSINGKTGFLRRETLVHIYTTRNVPSLKIIGKINPTLVYQGDLPWKPDSINNKCFWCGDINEKFGREAYLLSM
jgi:hypothetical protein